ncbi:MAG TPA: phospholipase D-like domain-containing protein, partial [Anaerolineales bacterium]|nr:phospholipase D-like domain-containing protein [Anaerolineales bacterium]
MSRRRKRAARGNPSATIFGLIIVIILGVIYVLTGGNSSQNPQPTDTALPQVATLVNPPGATPSNLTSQPPVSGGWWEVYFTDPVNMRDPAQWENSIEGHLIEKINAAQRSIHIASFEFDLTPVAEALIDAKQRGVDVRWVTDDESGLEADEEPGHGQFAMLQQRGIEVRSDSRSALMHNKFWIFDGQAVWTGSTNITESGIFKQDNNVLVIHSPEVAAIYEREFEEMWAGQFGPTSPSQLEEQTAVVNGSQIVVVFTSEDPALERAIVPIVRGAQSNIRFLAFTFTDFPLAQAIIDRSGRGVDSAGVFEKVGSDTDAAELKTLYCGGVPVRRDGNSGFLHHKYIVVDERTVITGSMNYSTNA